MRKFIVLFLSIIYYLPSTIYAASTGIDIGEHYAFGDVKTFGQGITLLVDPAFAIATTLVIIYFIIGAFKFLTSGGDKQAVSDARGMITHAIIGFIILIFSFLILQYIPEFFGFKFSIF